jgi:hypothetical protein
VQCGLDFFFGEKLFASLTEVYSKFGNRFMLLCTTEETSFVGDLYRLRPDLITVGASTLG